uniref:Uncharacterized protein n=1 Tax=Sphaerodactylus townsendi TaxID=933632 RepID=A0ACB8E9T1_9SAUR
MNVSATTIDSQGMLKLHSKELEKWEWVQLLKEELKHLEEYVKVKEDEVAHVSRLLEDAVKAVDKWQVLVKDIYANLDLEYCETVSDHVDHASSDSMK